MCRFDSEGTYLPVSYELPHVRWLTFNSLVLVIVVVVVVSKVTSTNLDHLSIPPYFQNLSKPNLEYEVFDSNHRHSVLDADSQSD